jgi:PASTA domain
MADLDHRLVNGSGGSRPAARRMAIRRLRRRQEVAGSAVVAAALLIAACSSSTDPPDPAPTPVTSATTSVPSRPPPSASPSSSTSTASATTAPSRTTPTVQRIAVPALDGTTVGRAKTSLARRHLRWRITNRQTTRYPPGTVASQSPTPGTPVLPATVIVLVIAQAPPQPPPPPPPPATDCDPAYPDVCLKDGIGDYDCAAGSGNGPNYVSGPIAVRPPDPFDLDRNGDGVGCENG